MGTAYLTYDENIFQLRYLDEKKFSNFNFNVFCTNRVIEFWRRDLTVIAYTHMISVRLT